MPDEWHLAFIQCCAKLGEKYRPHINRSAEVKAKPPSPAAIALDVAELHPENPCAVPHRLSVCRR